MTTTESKKEKKRKEKPSKLNTKNCHIQIVILHFYSDTRIHFGFRCFVFIFLFSSSVWFTRIKFQVLYIRFWMRIGGCARVCALSLSHNINIYFILLFFLFFYLTSRQCQSTMQLDFWLGNFLRGMRFCDDDMAVNYVA